MRKLTTLILVLAFTNLSIFAQDSDSRKPSKGDYGFSMDIAGLFLTFATGKTDAITGNQNLLLRYMLTDNIQARLGLGINSINNKNSNSDSLAFFSGYVGANQVYSAAEGTTKRFDVYLAPGIEKHFAGGDKVDPYFGAEIVIGMVGKTTLDSTNEAASDLYARSYALDQETEGGFGFGINLVAGFNYFFARKIALGAEVSWGFNTLTSGGDTKTTTTAVNSGANNTNVGVEPASVVSESISETKSSGVNVGSSGASAGLLVPAGFLNLTIFF